MVPVLQARFEALLHFNHGRQKNTLHSIQVSEEKTANTFSQCNQTTKLVYYSLLRASFSSQRKYINFFKFWSQKSCLKHKGISLLPPVLKWHRYLQNLQTCSGRIDAEAFLAAIFLGLGSKPPNGPPFWSKNGGLYGGSFGHPPNFF